MLNTIWWFLLGISIIMHKQDGDEEDSEEPCTLIIVFRNELKNLEELLPSLEEQQFRGDAQLLLVDDRSTDGSAGFVRGFSFKNFVDNQLISITEVPVDISPKKFGLQKAIEIAQFENLVFTDADCLPISERWIQELKNGLSRSAIFIGLGEYQKEPGFLNRLIQYDTFLTAFQFSGWALMGSPYMALGRNWGYKKWLFEEKNGFEEIAEKLGGDDDLLFQRISKNNEIEISFSRDSRTISKPETKFFDWFRQKQRHLSVAPSYSARAKMLTISSVFNPIFIFLMIGFLIVDREYLLLTWSMILFRYVMVYWMSIGTGKKLGYKSGLFVLPLTELVYWLYQLSAFFASLFNKNPEWKKEENFQARR